MLGYFQAGKTFFGGIRLGTEEPRQFEGGFKPFGGFRRPLRSFFTVFLDIFLFCLGAILRPPEGGSRIFCLFWVAAVAVVADILRRSKTVFFLFYYRQAFLRFVVSPPGAGPVRIEARDVGMACAVARPDEVRPPSGYPGGAIVSTAKAILSRYHRFPGISGGTRVRRHCAARPSIFWQSRRGVHKHRAIPEGQL